MVMIVVLVSQALLAPEPGALAWTLFAALATLITVGHCLRQRTIGEYPMSTLAVLGFNAGALSIPMIAQSLSGRSVFFNLDVPELTWRSLVAVQLLLVATHYLYVKWAGLNRIADHIANKLYRPLGIFSPTTELDLWILGFIGMGATWASRILYATSIEYGDVGGKFMQGLVFFIAFPFFIPFRGMFLHRKVAVSSVTLGFLAAYFVLVVLTAVAANVRIIFSFVGVDLLVATALLMAMGRLRLSSRAKLTVASIALLSLPVVDAFDDLATAMELAREQRGTVGGQTYIVRTYAAFQDKPTLERYREFNEDGAGTIVYSEAYIKSKFLNRLAYVKPTDLTLDASGRLAPSQRDAVRQDFVVRVQAVLPTPIAAALGIKLDKSALEYSVGDLYQNLVYGRELGSFLTGSNVTNAQDIFGKFALPALGMMSILIFIFADSLRSRAAGFVVISPVAFILLSTIFTRSLNSDSTAALIGGIRDTIQNVLIFAVLRALARVVSATLLANWAAPVRRRAV